MLVSYWLKTVYAAGHKSSWWRELNELLKQVVREEPLNQWARESIQEVQAWIQNSTVLNGKGPKLVPPRQLPFRANLPPERLAAYVEQLLNRWLSSEVAYLLVNETDAQAAAADGIPGLAVGRALERVLVRERLSPGTLEMLLEPEMLSPRSVYPADAEMLRDVVLALLGRTEAPEPAVMPAALLGVADGAPLPATFFLAV